MSAPVAGRRERTKAANRAAILAAARDVFAEDGYDAAGVRDIIRRTDLASGTFYNYFPDKDAIFRALVEETGAEARRRVRAARRRAGTAQEFI
jgi:AcrR family transcriptional regulator